MVGAAVVAGVVGGAVGADVEAGCSSEMQLAVHSAPAPPALLLFDRNCPLRVRPFTVTSGELSSQNLKCFIDKEKFPGIIVGTIY